MSKYQNYSENIASYLDGDMSPDQMQEFEMQLHTDPVLRSEFNLQQDIIHSIKDFRKTQLKTQLDQVAVSAGPSGVVGITAATAIVISGIIGLGAYLYLLSPSEETSSITVDEAHVQAEVITETEVVAETSEEVIIGESNELIESNEVVKKPEAKSSEIKTTKINTTTQSVAISKPVTPSKDDTAQKTTEELSPVINSPTLVIPELDESDVEESFEAPNAGLAQEGLMGNNIVEIETAKRDVDMFHYQYFSGKLYLYGDFRDNPYEILELNSANGKQLFIFYNGTYYRVLDNQQEITPLEKLSSPDIIKKLEIIQENK